MIVGIPPRSVDFMHDVKLAALIQNLPEPSDRVYLDSSTAQKLFEYWKPSATCPPALLEAMEMEPNSEGDLIIPSDIVYTGTIPLPNLELWLSCLDGSTKIIQVFIFEWAKTILDQSPEWELQIVGLIRLDSRDKSSTMWIPIESSRGAGFLLTIGEHIRLTAAVKNPYLLPATLSQRADPLLVANIQEALMCWYSVQISLLHPQIKKAYRIKEPSKKSAKAAAKTGRKRCAKLIRRHYIDLESIEAIESENKRKYGRHCLAWYVCGHFRKYKNGKTVFIQGYWKGPLREAKMNLDEGRDRGLSLEGGLI